MKYTMNPKIAQKRIFELGFSSLGDFASKARIHRNTLQNLVRGQSVFSRAFESVSKALQMDPLDLLSPQSDFRSQVKEIDEIRPIVAVLVREQPGLAVVLIGSRASRRARRYSDWDLGVVRYPAPLSGLEYLGLKNRVEDLSENLVRRVDLVNLNQAPSWFLEGLADGMIFLDGNQGAFTYLKGLTDGVQKEKAA